MNDFCSRCGRDKRVSAISGSEVLLNIASAILLLSASILIYRVANQCLDLQVEHIRDHVVWREPLQSWNF